MPPKTMPIMRAYGWLFLLCGAVFVAVPGPLMELISLGADFIPNARPVSGGELSYWLVLTGSMMAMISYLSLAVAANPRLRVAWNTLLLSKGMSTALFVLFAVLESNTLYLVGSVVDGTIFLHLFWLRGRCANRYTVWFIKFNDPKTRNALWLRYTTLNRTGTCWFVLFDAAERKTHSGRWDIPGEDIPTDLIGSQRASASGPEASWDFSWKPDPSPVFEFVPRLLAALGLAGTVYETPVSSGKFAGSFRLGGKSWEFSDAPGCIGHLRGKRMGDNWRWAHAIFEDGTVFEILSAQALWGPFRSPRLTIAHLWREGRHFVSAGLRKGLSNRTEAAGEGWRFRVDFGEFSTEGECTPPADMTALVDYTDTDGRHLLCANSKTAALRMKLDGSVLEIKDTAAVETVVGDKTYASARWVFPYALAYGKLVGVRVSESGIHRRLGMLPIEIRFAAAMGAFLILRLARFESLSKTDADRLLQRLQSSRSLIVKCLFFPLRAVTLPEIYGSPERMARFGYTGKVRK